MMKLNIKKTNASIKNENDKLKECLIKHLDLIDREPEYAKTIKSIMEESGYIEQFNKLKLFDQEAFKMYKTVNKKGHHSIGMTYFFDRVHREFPDFGASFDDFITICYAWKQLHPMIECLNRITIDIVKALSEFKSHDKEKGE